MNEMASKLQLQLSEQRSGLLLLKIGAGAFSCCQIQVGDVTGISELVVRGRPDLKSIRSVGFTLHLISESST